MSSCPLSHYAKLFGRPDWRLCWANFGPQALYLTPLMFFVLLMLLIILHTHYHLTWFVSDLLDVSSTLM